MTIRLSGASFSGDRDITHLTVIDGRGREGGLDRIWIQLCDSNLDSSFLLLSPIDAAAVADAILALLKGDVEEE